MFPVRPGVWRVDIELPRDKVTGKRRRISRNVEGTRNEAEVALSRLRVADREKRLPSGGTSARSVRAALDLYLAAAETGQIELAPRTVVTTRSAASTMNLVDAPTAAWRSPITPSSPDRNPWLRVRPISQASQPMQSDVENPSMSSRERYGPPSGRPLSTM